MALTCINPPLVEPVALAELKEMLSLPPADTSRDSVLTGLGQAARAWCEVLTKRRFVQQTWRLSLDYFPGYIDNRLTGSRISSPFVSGSNAILVGIRYAIVLPSPPIQSLGPFQYLDANGGSTTMAAGVDFIADLASQPARLTPMFGKMWPVARVQVNAVNIDHTVGYATPVAGSMAQNAKVFVQASPPSFLFTSANVGQPISVPGAGPNFGALNTIVASVSGGVPTLRDGAACPATATTALLVNYGNPGHWPLIQQAIKVLVNSWFVNRMPSYDAKTRDCICGVLGPVRDMRL